ncbi:MAG: hypothetical protein U0984_19910 [Prosthecobacter sp.]|nr:hypothetical protein [Prosthecobacter sp.]
MKSDDASYVPEFEYDEMEFQRDFVDVETLPKMPSHRELLSMFLNRYPMMREAQYKLARVLAAIGYLQYHESSFAKYRQVFGKQLDTHEALYEALWGFFSGISEDDLRNNKFPAVALLLNRIRETEAVNPHKSHLPPDKGKPGLS